MYALTNKTDAFYSAHNPEIRGTTLYLSWYSDGLRIVDISQPSAPLLPIRNEQQRGGDRRARPDAPDACGAIGVPTQHLSRRRGRVRRTLRAAQGPRYRRG